MFDGKAFGKEIVAVVKSYVDRQLAPLKAQIVEMQKGYGLKYLGVWQRQQSYKAGSMVTHKGAMWHANDDTAGVEPGDAKLWTLAVKAAAPVAER